MSATVPDDAPKPRECHVRKWDDFNGYGFNLHAEKGKAGQYIGKVDPGSPAEYAGLKEGDRIVEVNGTNISNENHQQVVQRVKAITDETKLLVVDAEAEEYYKNLKVVVRGDMPNVQRGAAPEINPNAQTAVNVVENNVSDIDSDKDEDIRAPTPPSPAVEEVTETAVVQATAHSVDPVTAHPYRARLCHLKIWPDFQGYGFNLHAEKNKSGQYIGKVDPGSPAEVSGLRENDRIIEVNGQNVTGESHQHVVTIVKSVPNETKLLVLSPEADDYFRERGVLVTGSSDFVDRNECPDVRSQTVTAVASTPSYEASESHPYKARLVELRTWPNYNGYGFNMHSIKGKEGEFIGKVEPGSPAFCGGLKEGDRVIQVGDFNTEKSSHAEVVEKIKAAAGRATLLVVDVEADSYFREKQMALSSKMAAVTVLTCPDNKPEANGTSEAITSQVDTDYSPPVADQTDNDREDLNDYEQVNNIEDRPPTPQPDTTDLQNNNEDEKDVIITHTEQETAYTQPAYSEPEPAYNEPEPEYNEPEPAYTEPEPVVEEAPPSYESEVSQAQASPTPAPAPAPVRKEPVVVGGIEFAGSVEEAKKRMSGKKKEVRSSSSIMSAKEKFELFQKL